MEVKTQVKNMIENYIAQYQRKPEIVTEWGTPLVGFADADSPEIQKLKEVVSPEHDMPKNVIAEARIIIAYFLPFTRAVAETNKKPDNLASEEWARAYEETNVLLTNLNEHIIKELKSRGFQAGVSKESSVFYRNELISHWSQRHIAKAAGLGTFGINNMLITEKGCCGRYSSVVTNLNVEADSPLEEEYCLYKSHVICGVCVKHCPSGALTFDGYDRYKCYEVCLKNAQKHKGYGASYTDGSGEDIGSEVCGKCVVNAPCTFR